MSSPVSLFVHVSVSHTLSHTQVEIDPVAIAADFPLLDPPPRKRGLGQLLVGAVKGVSQVGDTHTHTHTHTHTKRAHTTHTHMLTEI